MAELGEVHLHLPAGFRGVIHLHVGADAGADAGPAAVRPVQEDPEAAVGDEPPDAAIEEMCSASRATTRTPPPGGCTPR